MDEDLKSLEQEFELALDPDLLTQIENIPRRREMPSYINTSNAWELWTQFRDLGVVPIQFLQTAIRQIEAQLHREFYHLYWPPERRRGLINGMDFTSPERERVTFERWVNQVSFHLSPCVCNAPSWQQPCPFCGFFPDYGASRRYLVEYIEKHRNRTSKERFLATLGAEGIANYWAKSMAWRAVPEWKSQAEQISRSALKKIGQLKWPSNEEIWDTFTHQTCIVPGCNYSQDTSYYLNAVGAPFSINLPKRIPYCAIHNANKV